MCRVPWFFMPASLAGNTVTANMKAGSRIVLTMNDLARTRSRYSRRMISQVLRILFAHHVDEDFFQRGFHQLELVSVRVRHAKAQRCLCASAGRKARAN